ncbi:MAG TPA: type II toxin-antitoxin system Phd/YefM family antitoxin [Anaerolineales bacterium]|nr:type II toxin-antitoxin system Phd/YefM family antitoxin [Anaerolineales bacterium]
MKKVPLSEIKDQLSKYLKLANREDIIITKHGRPAGILIGFSSEDDWLDYRLEHDARFLRRIAEARESLRMGKGKRLEEIE